MIDPIPAQPAPTLPVDVTLERRLGPLDAAAIVVSNVIGSGIFFVPIIVAQMVPHPGWMLSLWLAGGALALVGAMAYAELAAVRPHAGGEYVYLRDAYGPLAAFLTGWTSFVAGFSGAVAANAVALADSVTRFVPAAANAKQLIAVSAIALLTLIHVRGLGPGRLVQNFLAGLKVTALVLIIAFGFAIGNGDAANLSTAAGAVTPLPWLLALVPVMFSYSGWNAAAYVAEEVRNPTRNVPLALALGTTAVIVLYVGLNALYLFAMPIVELRGVSFGRLLDTVADRLFGFATGDLLAVFTIVSLAASISAMVLAGPRVYFAMARDGVFFQKLGEVHPKFGTPAFAVGAGATVAAIYSLVGTFQQLLGYVVFVAWIFYAIAAACVIRFRTTRADWPRPFKVPGYPITPLIFILSAAAIVGNTIVQQPWKQTAIAFGIMGAGIPAFLLWKSRKSQA